MNSRSAASDPEHRSSTRTALAVVGGILGLAVLLRLGRMGDSLWYDELWSTRLKLQDLWAFAVSSSRDVHPPGYATVMFGWIRGFGDSEWSVRFVPLAAGVATVWITYRIGRLVFDELTGRFAAVLLAIAPVHVWYSQEARSYALTTCLAALGALAVIELTRQPAARRWAWTLGLVIVTLPIIHFYTLSVSVVMAAMAWLSRLPQRKWFVVWAVASGAAVTGFVLVKQQMGLFTSETLYLRGFSPTEAWHLFFGWFLSGDGLAFYLQSGGLGSVILPLTQLVGFLALAFGVMRCARESQPAQWLVAALFGCVPLALASLWAIGWAGTYIERSALAALPFFLVLLAAGVTARVRARLVAAVVAASLVAFQVAGLVATFAHRNEWTVYKPRPEWRELSAWLRSGLADVPGDRQAVLLARDPAISLAYYDDLFAEKIDFATKIRERRGQIVAAARRFGLSADGLLDWVTRGADAAIERSRRARVLIVDSPLVNSTRDDLLSGKLATPVVVVHVGDGPPPRALTEISASARFRETGRASFRSLHARIFVPVER
jgi:4-amino-4-deoxy-L-arabinose transferase-like glycosyltransferase